MYSYVESTFLSQNFMLSTVLCCSHFKTSDFTSTQSLNFIFNTELSYGLKVWISMVWFHQNLDNMSLNYLKRGYRSFKQLFV